MYTKVFELAMHVVRQRAALVGQQLDKPGVMLGNELVEQCPFRAVALIAPFELACIGQARSSVGLR